MNPSLARVLAQPIAHRGLHDRARGVIENSIGAARAAIAAGYAIECDVQRTKDGALVVFHDDTLERLTTATGKVADYPVATLTQMRLRDCDETIPCFEDFLAAIGGRAPLVVEIKSAFDGDMTAPRRLAERLAHDGSAVVIESFDPAPIAWLRAHGAALGVGDIALGIVGQAHYESTEWPELAPDQRLELAQFLHYPRTRPDFLSWNLADLPHAVPFLARSALNIPVTSWTVRSQQDAARARRWADQIVFEGFAPA